MGILDWWRSRKSDSHALEEARAQRKIDRDALTQAVVTLHNEQTQLKSLMTAMLEKRGGHDA